MLFFFIGYRLLILFPIPSRCRYISDVCQSTSRVCNFPIVCSTRMTDNDSYNCGHYAPTIFASVLHLSPYPDCDYINSSPTAGQILRKSNLIWDRSLMLAILHLLQAKLHTPDRRSRRCAGLGLQVRLFRHFCCFSYNSPVTFSFFFHSFISICSLLRKSYSLSQVIFRL